MRYPEQLAIRVPEGTKGRIRAQAASGETLVSVLLRALTALETAPKRLADTEPRPDLEKRLAAIEKRLGDLEQKPTLSPSPKPRPQLIGENNPTDPDKPAATGSGSRVRYNDAAKRLALNMTDAGATHRQICDELQRQTGHAPNHRTLADPLKRWRQQLGR